MKRMRLPVWTLAAAWVVFCATVSGFAGAGDDPELLREGRDLYFGTRPFSTPGRIAGAALPVSASACVNCHGPLGRGSREGAQAAPDITTTPPGGKADWLRALEGRGNAGRALATAMPRYSPDAREQAAVAAYSRVLGTPADPVRGVSDAEIVLGVRNASGAARAAQREVLAGVKRAAAAANERGGVHGRRVRVVEVNTPDQALEIFAWVASLIAEPVAPRAEAAARLPELASLAMFSESVARASWTVPLFASLREQAGVLDASLVEAAGLFHCEPWLLETFNLRKGSLGFSGIGANRRFGSVSDALSVAPASRVCIGLIADAATADSMLRALRERRVTVPFVVSLAALGTPTTIDPETVRRTVLPAPATVALAASSDAAGGLWGVLGEASGRATIEALARSGRLLQPELVLEAMRSMGGYEPVAAAPLAYGRARTHGWAPALDSALPPTPTTAIAGSDPLPGAKP